MRFRCRSAHVASLSLIAAALLLSSRAGAQTFPVIEISTPVTLVPAGSEWAVWADESTPPPGWPLSAPPDRSIALDDLLGPDVAAQTERTLPIDPIAPIPDFSTPAEGEGEPPQIPSVPPGGVTGWLLAPAPFDGLSRTTFLSLTDAFAEVRARYARHREPLPILTRWVYESGVEATDGGRDDSPEPGLANLYFVRSFEWTGPPGSVAALQVQLEFAGGAVVWINGVEVARHHVPPGREGFGSRAVPYWLPDHMNQTSYNRWQDTFEGIDPGVLREGTNTIAVAIYKRPSGGRRALYFDLELQAWTEPGFARTPWLQQVEQNRITVMWETTVPAFGYVEYGPAGGPLSRVAMAPEVASTRHEIVLSPLRPDTRYAYRVHSLPVPFSEGSAAPAPILSAERSFRTSPPPGVPFRFVAYGDNRTQSDVHAAVIRQMWDDAVASDAVFVLSTGDLTTNSSSWHEWQNEYFLPSLPLTGFIPMYTVLGNHEGNHESYYANVSLPGNEAWYNFRAGDAEVFGVNSSFDYSPGSAQYVWLEGALAASDAAWKIATFHHPPYACTPSRRPGEIPVQEYLVPLFERYGVRLVLLGHDHLYGRSRELNGVTYVITGGGGAPSYPAVPDDINPICIREFHYCVVSVSAEEISLRAVGLGGTELDAFVLRHSR